MTVTITTVIKIPVRRHRVHRNQIKIWHWQYAAKHRWHCQDTPDSVYNLSSMLIKVTVNKWITVNCRIKNENEIKTKRKDMTNRRWMTEDKLLHTAANGNDAWIQCSNYNGTRSTWPYIFCGPTWLLCRPRSKGA